MGWLLAIVTFPLGLALGSFMTVVTARVPVGESVVRPRSRCPTCGVEIANREEKQNQLEQALQARVNPRVPGVHIRVIDLSPTPDGKRKPHAMIVRVPRSFVGPHQIEVEARDFQFWGRGVSQNFRKPEFLTPLLERSVEK